MKARAGCQRSLLHHMLLHMKQFVVELGDRDARDLERVAPAKSRKRSEFVRLAIRRAIDLALDRETEDAYAVAPLPRGLAAGDLAGWDAQNELARPALERGSDKPAQRRSAKRVA